MYKREAFNTLRYDFTLKSCEDYDIYLKIVRVRPVIHHPKLIAVYYHHESKMSGNMPLMLQCALRVLERQKESAKNEAESECLRQGLTFWKAHYCVNIYYKLVYTPSGKNKNSKNEVRSLYAHRKYLFFKYYIVKPLIPLKQFVVDRSPFLSKILHRIGLYEGFLQVHNS